MAWDSGLGLGSLGFGIGVEGSLGPATPNPNKIVAYRLSPVAAASSKSLRPSANTWRPTQSARGPRPGAEGSNCLEFIGIRAYRV